MPVGTYNFLNLFSKSRKNGFLLEKEQQKSIFDLASLGNLRKSYNIQFDAFLSSLSNCENQSSNLFIKSYSKNTHLPFLQ
jgi:hypothetical protein